MPQAPLKAVHTHRRHFIGGSDARIIMGTDEGALVRLWREKRGEVEPEPSGNLICSSCRDLIGAGTRPIPGKSLSMCSSGSFTRR